MKNKLKQILASKQPAIGTWIAITDVYSVEMIAGLGFDWLLIDMEHIPISKENLRSILLACKGSVSVPIVRVAAPTVENIQSALDLGAQGIMAPMINTVAEAEHLVRCCRYPPQGRRGMGPIRASGYLRQLEEYRSEANNETLVFAQIETPEAVKNAAAIMGTPGMDGIYIGNADLANFMNHDAKAGSANVQQVVDDLIKTAVSAALPIGLPTWSTAEFNRYVELGATLLTIGSDLSFLASRAETTLKEVRSLRAPENGSTRSERASPVEILH
jgi:4-hydroxy-2-oxoheptanedioate aldolase